MLLALAGCEKWELDRRMEELCKKDGGVRVYETVTLPASAFDQTGSVIMSAPRRSNEGFDVSEIDVLYRLEDRTEVLKDGNPYTGLVAEGRLFRHQTTVRRVADGKVLGVEVSYGRVGGDFGYGHPSQNYCPKPRPSPGVIQAVLKKGPQQ
jgi:hypothetical protein